MIPETFIQIVKVLFNPLTVCKSDIQNSKDGTKAKITIKE